MTFPPTDQPTNRRTSGYKGQTILPTDGHQDSKGSYTSNNVPIKVVGNKTSVFTKSRKKSPIVMDFFRLISFQLWFKSAVNQASNNVPIKVVGNKTSVFTKSRKKSPIVMDFFRLISFQLWFKSAVNQATFLGPTLFLPLFFKFVDFGLGKGFLIN